MQVILLNFANICQLSKSDVRAFTGVTDTPNDNTEALEKMQKLVTSLERASAEVARDMRMKTALETAHWEFEPVHPSDIEDDDENDVSTIT